MAYEVNNEPVLSSVRVQSQSSVESDADGSLGAAVDGSGLSIQSRTSVSATVGSEGSASMTAHDNEHGVLLVRAGENSQYVTANLSAGASTERESDKQVSVMTANGTEGTFIVIGEGNVDVSEEGNVSAELGSESRLTFRTYPDGKEDSDERSEAMIQNGTVTAELHAMERDGETVFDTVSYAGNTTVTASERTENGVNATVERSTDAGTVVITSVSEAAVGSLSELEVTVDGEAAAEASSASELRSAIGGDSSRYMVASEGSADARADVLVAVNHFSERDISVQGESEGSTSGGTPGFGVPVTLAALAVALIVGRRR